MTGNWRPHNVCLWHNRGDVKKLSAPAGADQKHATDRTLFHTNTFRECENPSSTKAFYNGQSYVKCFRVLLYAGWLWKWWKRSLSFSIQLLTRNSSSNSPNSQGQTIFSLNVTEDIAWELVTAHGTGLRSVLWWLLCRWCCERVRGNTVKLTSVKVEDMQECFHIPRLWVSIKLKVQKTL